MHDKTDGIENNFLNTSVTNQYEFSRYIVSYKSNGLVSSKGKARSQFLKFRAVITYTQFKNLSLSFL